MIKKSTPFSIFYLTSVIISFLPMALFAGTGDTFFANLQSNTWTKLPASANRFIKNAHADMEMNSAGSNLFVFGSDTHDDPRPDNSVHNLDLSTMTWTQSYPPDPVTSYQTIATPDPDWTITSTGNPWASHGYESMTYVPELDSLLFLGGPTHNYTGLTAAGNPSIKGAQTWLYDIQANQWTPLLNSNSPNVTKAGISYNPILKQVVLGNKYTNFKPNGHRTYYFDPQTLTWQTVVSTSPYSHGIQTYSGFDLVSGKTFLFGGTYPNNSRILEYDDQTHIWEELTPTTTPLNHDEPGASIAVDTLHKILAYVAVDDPLLADGNPSGNAKTWIFDLTTHDWSLLPIATPPHYGSLSFGMTYSAKYDSFIYFGGFKKNGGSSLWAFRFEKDGTSSRLIGDVNEDGTVNVLDLSKVIDIILGNSATTNNADCNQDNDVNVLDLSCIIAILLS